MNFKVVSTGAAHMMAKRFLGPFWIRRKWLKKTQWLSKSELEQIQLRLLKKLVSHCYNTVPYYKQLMDERGISVQNINTFEDIKKFPILTKGDLLRENDAFVSRKFHRWFMNVACTGGTTGTPLTIWRDVASVGNNHAFFRRQKDWAGIGLWTKCAYLTGRLITKPNHKGECLYAYDPFMKELILSTYHLSVKTAREYAQVIKRYKVKAIDGYPSAVYLFARTCLDYGIELEMQSVLTSSETLTDSMRDTISKAFQCPVYDYYGSAERTCIIHTCEEGTYHIVPEYGVTELIGIDGSDDNRCRIVATGFWNKAMPFIRYDTNDIVVRGKEKCPCGRAYPVIKSIEGRQADVIKAPSGREYGSAILTHLLYGTNHIVESQIIQDALDHIRIEYVPGENFSTKDLSDFERLVNQHLPSELKVELRKVSSVARTESGKIKPVVSEIY